MAERKGKDPAMTAPTEVTIAERPPGWAETWKSPDGFSSYEASDDSVWMLGEDGKPVQVTGGIRSVDRTVKGRRYKGTLLKARIMANSGGYAAVDVTDDEGVKRTMLVHRFILLAHTGSCPEGMETRHLVNDPLDCRWAPGETAEEVMAAGGNIIYGTPPDNAQDQFRNGRRRAEPKPDRYCVCCGSLLTTNGQRCHPCVVSIGEQAADLLRSDPRLDKACDLLDYPSAVGLHNLAAKYGGYGRPDRPGWAARLRRKFTRSDNRGGDGAPRGPKSPAGGDGA
jgi:hypothetical protein